MDISKLPKLLDDEFSELSEIQLTQALDYLQASGFIKCKNVKSKPGGENALEIELLDSAFKYYFTNNPVTTGVNWGNMADN